MDGAKETTAEGIGDLSQEAIQQKFQAFHKLERTVLHHGNDGFNKWIACGYVMAAGVGGLFFRAIVLEYVFTGVATPNQGTSSNSFASHN